MRFLLRLDEQWVRTGQREIENREIRRRRGKQRSHRFTIRLRAIDEIVGKVRADNRRADQGQELVCKKKN